MTVASKLYRLWKLYEYAPLRIKQKREDALTNYLFHGNHIEIADIIKNWDNLYPGDYGTFKKYINSQPVIKMHLGLNENKNMKITKDYLRSLIIESLQEVETGAAAPQTATTNSGNTEAEVAIPTSTNGAAIVAGGHVAAFGLNGSSQFKPFAEEYNKNPTGMYMFLKADDKDNFAMYALNVKTNKMRKLGNGATIYGGDLKKHGIYYFKGMLPKLTSL